MVEITTYRADHFGPVGVVAFWKKLGYDIEERMSLGKRV